MGSRRQTCDLADPDLAARAASGVGEREVGLLLYNAAYSRVGGFFEQSLANGCARGPIILSNILGQRMLARGRSGPS